MGYYNDTEVAEDQYYRIRMRADNKLDVVHICVWGYSSDEESYNQEDFFTDDRGYPLRFETEEEAEDWLNKNIKRELIADEHIKLKHKREDYFK